MNSQVLKPNTRFLSSIIKSTDGHNKALLNKNQMKRQRSQSISPQPQNEKDLLKDNSSNTSSHQSLETSNLKNKRGRGETGSHRMDNYFKDSYNPKRDIFDEHDDSFDWVDLLDEKGHLPWKRNTPKDLKKEKKKKKNHSHHKDKSELKSQKKEHHIIQKEKQNDALKNLSKLHQKDERNKYENDDDDDDDDEKLKTSCTYTTQSSKISQFDIEYDMTLKEKAKNLETRNLKLNHLIQNFKTREQLLPEKCPW